MYEDYKFQNLKKIILYAVAKSRRPVSYRDLYSELSDINRGSVYSALRKLENEKFLKRVGKNKGENSVVILNVKKIDRIENELKEHWESNWAQDWNDIAKNKIR